MVTTENYEDNSEELAAIRAKNEARARELEEKKNTPTIIDDATISIPNFIFIICNELK